MEIDSLKIAEQLLHLQSSIQSTLDKIEDLKEEMRAAVAANGNVALTQEIAGLGSVTASAAAERRLKGTEDVLNLDKWVDLDLGEQIKLKALGIVKTEKVYSSARKSAVSVKLTVLPAITHPVPLTLFS